MVWPKPVGNYVWFAATTASGGTELYRTTGATATLVRDIGPSGRSGLDFSSGEPQFGEMGGAALFAADDLAHGRELWWATPTASLVLDIELGGSSDPAWFTAISNTRAVFAATRSSDGRELWVTDGTPGGTTMLYDINPSSAPSSPTDFVAVGALVFFAATRGSDRELWVTDGTAGGTRRVKNIRSGSASSNPRHLFAGSSRLCFTADDGIVGFEPWVSDGTEAGTMLIADLNPSGSSDPEWLGEIGGQVVLSAEAPGVGREPFASPPSGTGAVRIADANRGFFGSIRPGATAVAFAGSLVLGMSDGHLGNEPCRLTPGSPWVITRLADHAIGGASSTPSEWLAVSATRLLYTAESANSGREVYSIDATWGVQLVSDFLPGPDGQDLAATFAILPSGDGFACLDNGVDGIEPVRIRISSTSLSIHQLSNIETRSIGSVSSSPTPVGSLDGRYFFAATTIAAGRELWRSDGTAGGTSLVASGGVPGSGSADPLPGVRLGDWLYYSAFFTGVGRELCRSDGNVVQLVSDLVSGDSSPTELTVFRDRVWFLADDGTGRVLFATDGTAPGTVAWPLAASVSEIANLRATTTHLFMTAREPNTGREVWATDGISPLARVTDIAPGPNDGAVAEPTAFSAMGESYYFASYDNKVRATDGSTDSLVYSSPAPIRAPMQFGVSSQLLWFRASGFSFISDSILNFAPSRGWDEVALGLLNSREFTEIGDETLFFGEMTNNFGFGTTWYLTASDGSTSGSRTIASTSTVSQSDVASMDRLHSAGDGNRAVFRVAPAHPIAAPGDSEPWISDGSVPGTRRLADLYPGSEGSDPAGFTSAGNNVFFTADSPTLGRELWVLPIDEMNGTVREVFGTGCAGSRGIPRIVPRSQPEIGTGSFRGDVRNASPLSPAFLFLSLRQDVQIGPCKLNVMTAIATVFGTVTTASGSGSLSIGIPNDPNLAGIELFEQWLVVEPGASLLGLFAVSDCLRFRIDVP